MATVLVALGVYLQPAARAQQANRVGLVIDFGDHHITRCVEFAESEITGYEVLRRAGLSVVVDASNPMGITVCDINDTSGCPESNCFCQCQGSPCAYWSYHHLVNGSWQYSQVGASAHRVHDGDTEGWGWGEGTINQSGAQPPTIAFDEICAAPVTATPIPTDTPKPPTATPIPPTNTPAPTPVPAPEAWFRLDENPIAAGSCTVLRWDTSSAQGVYLDGEAVGMSGSRQVCPTAPTDYALRVAGLQEEESFRLTLGVTDSLPTATAPRSAETGSPSPSPKSSSPTTTPSPASRLATDSLPSSNRTVPASSTPEPNESTASSKPARAGSTVGAQSSGATSTATPVRLAKADGAKGGALEESQTVSKKEQPRSPFLPSGYIAFSLIVGGLVGWLIHLLRSRGARA